MSTSENIIQMAEQDMEATVGSLDKSRLNMEDTGNKYRNDFSDVKDSGLFSSGLNAIDRQIKSLGTSIFNVKATINNHSKNMFEMDRKMAKKAESIEIPQDFVENNSMKTNTFREFLLEKVDSRSVNDGVASTEKVDDTPSIAKTVAQKMGDITSSLNVKEEKLDETTGISAKAMTSISKDSNVDSKNLDDVTNLTAKALNSINKKDGLTEQALNDDFRANKQKISNINNGSTGNNINVDESIGMIGKSVIDAVINGEK